MNTMQTEPSLNKLPFYSQQALTLSQGWAERYMRERVGGEMAFDEQSLGTMASARLEWVLGYARRELAGQFMEADIVHLLNCYQAEVFFPDQFRTFASDLLNDLGVELDEYHELPIAPLIDKLRELTPVQRLALADALEQTWYRGLPAGKGVGEFFGELGIELAVE